MYQRIFIFGRSESWPRLAAAPEAEDERNDCSEHLIDDEEEQAREHHQHQHEPGGDQGLAPRRPDDLGALSAHLLNELEWVGHCLDVGLKSTWRATTPSQKNSRRGASRRRATPTSYRKRRPLAKRNVTS